MEQWTSVLLRHPGKPVIPSHMFCKATFKSGGVSFVFCSLLMFSCTHQIFLHLSLSLIELIFSYLVTCWEVHLSGEKRWSCGHSIFHSKVPEVCTFTLLSLLFHQLITDVQSKLYNLTFI